MAVESSIENDAALWTTPSWSFSAKCHLIPSWLAHSLHALLWPSTSLRFLNAISPQDQVLLCTFSHCRQVVCAFSIHLQQIDFQQPYSHFWNFIAMWFSGTHLGSLKCSKVETEKWPEAMSHRGEGLALSYEVSLATSKCRSPRGTDITVRLIFRDTTSIWGWKISLCNKAATPSASGIYFQSFQNGSHDPHRPCCF